MSTLSDRTRAAAPVRLAIDGTSALKLRPGLVCVPSALYNEDYYERGVEKGISGYSNYRWIPELTLPMAMTMIDTLGVRAGQRVLDFGCAKGFTVKALRMLRRDAHGVDISSYAIGQAPDDVAPFCHHISDLADFTGDHRFDYVIAKDVLEHVPYEVMDGTLACLSRMADVVMVVVPLGHTLAGGATRFLIEAYERDITHIVREGALWWNEAIGRHWRDVTWRHHIDGIKDNWHAVDPVGNAVFIARGSRRL